MPMLLYLRDPMMTGPAVRRAQEMLSALHLGLGEWGPDGVYGPITVLAVKAFQRTHGLTKIDGKVGKKTWTALEDAIENTRGSWHAPEIAARGIIDIRGQHDRPRYYDSRYSPRSWSSIDSVVLHQTGCKLADRPSRWESLNAHIGIMRDGTIILVNPLDDFIWHCQGGTKRSIGVEINGNMVGDLSNPNSYHKSGGGPHPLTPEQIEAGEVLIEWLEDEFVKHGAELKFVFPHRVFKNTRRADPGEAIWKEIAQPWIDDLELSDGGPGYFKGSGRPIPSAWQPLYHHKY